MPRPTPWDVVFADLAADRFPAIATALEAGGIDPWQRDAFLLARPVVELLRDLRPDTGLGEAIDEFAAFLHHGFLFWQGGRPVVAVGPETLGRLGGAPPSESRDATPAAYYAQLPERRVWGTPVPDAASEPLDGWFMVRHGLRRDLVGVFGLHPHRAGFSAVTVGGPAPGLARRPDGTPLLAPALDGGAAAGLFSVVTMGELLELAWRIDRAAGDRVAGAGTEAG